MGLKQWVKFLERSASGEMDSFVLVNGSTYYYDPMEAYKQLFLYCYDLELGDVDKWPEPPEILRKICLAQNPAAVLERFKPRHPTAAVNLPEIIDVDKLVRERRLLLKEQ